MSSLFTHNELVQIPVVIPGQLPSYMEIPQEEVRICIAEDHKANRMVFKNILERLDYTNIHMYENGRDAVNGIIKRAEEGEPYHVIFMDILMPAMGGEEATKILRANDAKVIHDVPIISMSAQCDYLPPLGMTDFISKPLELQSMRRIMEDFGRPRRLVETKPISVSGHPLCQPRL
ncbi:hypothetical protein S40293_03957 [Stachybotrys chartarum IBT 40293]|nr:hypothetical protein S40293_03957 [Stachybotrys chartarum IBT 40293]